MSNGCISYTLSLSSPQTDNLDGAFCVPDIKLHSNPSAFNVYCNVRHCVLEWQQREASLALASRSSMQSGDSDSEEEFREPASKLPKVTNFFCYVTSEAEGREQGWWKGRNRI